MARSKKSDTKKTSKSKIGISLILLVVLLIADFVSTKLPQDAESNSTPRISIVETLWQNFMDFIKDSETDDSNDSETPNEGAENNSSSLENNESFTDATNVGTTEYTDEQLVVYFFDVGQADCILLVLGDEIMLVDTGNAGDAQETGKLVKGNINVTHELQRLGIEEIDILVATHPHEDHMGSMYKIINAFDVKHLYANPLLDESDQPNYYKRFVTALENSGVHFISPTTLTEPEIIEKVEEYNAMLLEDAESEETVELLVYSPDDYIRLGDTINFGSATVTMIAPGSAEYSDTNDYSIVLMVEFEGVKLLLTGDAGKESEEEILAFAEATGFDLDCDVLKVGHHGSRTANTEAFITAVSPEYAIVMVAEGNSYGLPDEDVIERLERHNAVVYQTMDCGDIRLVIDNGSYEFDFSYTHEEKPED